MKKLNYEPYRETIILACVGPNWELGNDNDLVYKLREDLKHFKKLTMGQSLIMGRKTYESLPPGGLPGRHIIVLTRDKNYVVPGDVEVAHDPIHALRLTMGERAFICGGAEIYKQFINMADRLFLTIVLDKSPPEKVDTYFPEPNVEDWVQSSHSRLHNQDEDNYHSMLFTFWVRKALAENPEEEENEDFDYERFASGVQGVFEGSVADLSS